MVDRHHPGKAPMALLQLLAGGGIMTVREIEAQLDLTRRQISDAAACLSRRDYLHWLGAGRYQLNGDGLAAAARGEVIKSGPRGGHNRIRDVRNTLRERVWRSMRLRKSFTVPDLISDAATDQDRRPQDNIYRYLRVLKAAGYVAELPRRAAGAAITSNGYKRWMLIRDTGPLAPSVRENVAAIHDFNIGEDVPCSRN
ncbi:hypothetical protein H4P12_08305 [Paracoccus sp. 11-3]|uniref:Uncharacterized protein n=1 Tax=Paracoccus amoyensis TaxID=2760093 RepID=A0A926JDA1_9RHOB|nr:hypothetical protein [Paracoccus amoyensis]MBC9246713.1 hypothetical protein [Paracoccus amoyensis]